LLRRVEKIFITFRKFCCVK